MAPVHHDALVQIDGDVTMALELMELATTWEELDYSGEAVIPPSDWLDFAAIHDWRDPELAARLFGVALDVVNRSPRPAGLATSGPVSGFLGPSGPLSGFLGPSGPLSGCLGPSGPLSGVAARR
jgi:hypothetical protein